MCDALTLDDFIFVNITETVVNGRPGEESPHTASIDTDSPRKTRQRKIVQKMLRSRYHNQSKIADLWVFAELCGAICTSRCIPRPIGQSIPSKNNVNSLRRAHSRD
jgi:hypothetical protein